MSLKPLASVALTLALAACAPMPRMPLQLVDGQAKASQGSLDPNTQRLEVVIGNTRFEGFYVVATGTAQSQSFPSPWPMRRSFPLETVTTFQSNTARASLKSADGQYLACEFVFQERKAAGECKETHGMIYQFIVGE
ncbi:MAG: hypothetical protein EKK46_11865 [Rhodocyclaceae bacterium]|nr:MAG: hypothetical protein EKK46_11865 [Rhodocyclaceae bacterium]